MISINPRHDGPPRTRPAKFRVGQLVCHRRYGYRGVVVALTPACVASPQWYMTNKTQPKREQPWYHVLVDGSDHSTYAAEENLEADDSTAEVDHPWLAMFFNGFESGRYQRNDREWPV